MADNRNADSRGWRCKPGDRARIIGGRNLGRIVLVLRPYMPGETVSGISNWMARNVPWVVVSLSGPLTCTRYIDGVPAWDWPPVMTIAIEDAQMVPLRDNEGGVELVARRQRKRAVKAALA